MPIGFVPRGAHSSRAAGRSIVDCLAEPLVIESSDGSYLDAMTMLKPKPDSCISAWRRSEDE